MVPLTSPADHAKLMASLRLECVKFQPRNTVPPPLNRNNRVINPTLSRPRSARRSNPKATRSLVISMIAPLGNREVLRECHCQPASNMNAVGAFTSCVPASKRIQLEPTTVAPKSGGNVGNHAMASYSTTKKARERYMALEAAKLLARQWVLSDHEAPDFIVTEDGERFGLELCEVFSGRETRKGSARKDQEVRVQRCIDRLRKQYEAETGTPLSVRLVGCLSHENLKGLVPGLLALDLASERQGHLTRFSLDQSEASLSVHVCRALPGHARWFSVNDRVGWVDRNPTPRIQAAVDAKAAHLARYRARTGLPEQRLLLFCDATTNKRQAPRGAPGSKSIPPASTPSTFTPIRTR